MNTTVSFLLAVAVRAHFGAPPGCGQGAGAKAKLTGDVDVNFQSDTFSLEGFADGPSNTARFGGGPAGSMPRAFKGTIGCGGAGSYRFATETIDGVDFPVFVADLIDGVFHANVDASVQQMNAYADLLETVAKTVDGIEAAGNRWRPWCRRVSIESSLPNGQGVN